jgi:hypothetical protein
MKKVISVILTYLLLALPIIAQQNQTNACTQAQIDAKNEIDGNIWFGAGCLFGLVGLGAAYVLEPSVPATKLLGKDAEYVAYYTECYQDAGKDLQTSKAMTGCLIGTGVQIAFYVLLIATASSTANDPYYY